MIWFFEDSEKVALLRSEALSWMGTPFALFSRAKGEHGGIDCLGLVEELTAAVGLEQFAFERSDEDYSRHVHNDKILRHLRGLIENEQSTTLKARWAEMEIIDRNFAEVPLVGDLLILKDGRPDGQGVFHMPIMLSSQLFVHCAPRLGVIEGQIDDPTYANHLVAHFRARETPL